MSRQVFNRLFLFFFCISLVGVGHADTQTQVNLIKNGDFEKGTATPEGWFFTTWSSSPSRGSFQWSTDSHSGKYSAKIVGVENAGKESVRSLLFCTPIEVKEGLLRLKGWYRTHGDSQAAIQIFLYGEDFAAKQFSTPALDQISRTLKEATDWSSFEVDLNVKPGVKQVVLLLRATDLGEVFYDDLSLESVKDSLILRLYPAEYGRNNTLPLVKGTPNFARMMLMGDRQQIKKSAELVLDLPEGTGDFGLLSSVTSVTREGHPFVRFRLPVSSETLSSLQKTISGCSVALWIDADKIPEEGSVFYHAVVDGVDLPEKQARVKVFPPLPDGPLPSRFHNLFCWSLFYDVPEKLYPAVYRMIRQMGVDHHLAAEHPTGWTKYLLDRLRAEGGTLWANIPWQYNKATEGNGGETRITTQGKSFFACDEGYYRRLLPTVKGAFWDWEPANALTNPLWDDPPTVSAFAKKEGLDVNTLTKERLQGELRDRFLKFRTWQLGEVVRLWAAYVHDLSPDLMIAMCQGAGMPPERGVEYKVYDDIPNLVHLPMIYTSSPMDYARNVTGMRDYLPKSKLFPMTSTSMLADGGWLAGKSPRGIYFDYVTSALLGCYGCSHWADLCRGFDMEYVWEVSRAMHHVACVEDFLVEGQQNPKTVTVKPLPESEARIKTGRGELILASPQWEKFLLCVTRRFRQNTLVAVCNMHTEKPATVQVRISDAQGPDWFVFDPVMKTLLVPLVGKKWKGSDLVKGFLFEVPAASLGMLVISRQLPTGGLKDVVRSSEVNQRFETRRAQAKTAGDITSIRNGELEINWADLDGDGYAEIRLASKRQQLGLGPSGNLRSWKIGDHKEDLVNRFDGGGAIQDQFWWPEAARTSEDKRGDYELVTRESKGGRVTVVFRRILTHWALGGLVLEKSYSITEGKPEFEVRVNLRNESPTAHEFSYWSHNCFTVGKTPTLVVNSPKGVQVFSGEQQPRSVWAPLVGLPEDQITLITKPYEAELSKTVFSLGQPAGPRLEINTDASLLQLYRWWDGTQRGQYTIEWMYQKQRLLPAHLWTTRFTVSWEKQ